jgi:DNA-binding MarR family transcriptional regulator
MKEPVNALGSVSVGQPGPVDGERSREVPDYNTIILHSLRRIIRAVEIYSRKLATKYRVTGPQLVCLVAIIELGPVTATGIAREVHLSTSTVVGILARLEEKGLIVRHRSERDRRQIHVMPTAEGRILVETAPSPLQDTLSLALSGLNSLEQATIALSLQRVVELMEAPDVDKSSILETPGQIEGEAGPHRVQEGEGQY